MRGVVLLAAALLASGCAAREAPPSAEPLDTSEAFGIASDAFDNGEPMPIRFTCEGDNVSPPLRIAHAPANATVLALTVIDSDVPTPDAPVREFTHWLVWNVPLVDGSARFAEGAVPAGAVEGAHDGAGEGWTGPCPPPASSAHRYVFTARALDGPLDLPVGATRAEFETAVEGRVLANATLVGTYERGGS